MKYVATSENTILNTLIQLLPQNSKTTLKSWIKEGRIQIDGILVKNTCYKVLKDQVITIGRRKKIIGPGISLLYEDRNFVIIDKPSGILSVATAFEKGETVHALLKVYYYPRKVFVIHRLDQDTSGIMIFALNQKMCDQLKNLFSIHAIERAYTAIIEGRFPVPSGTWQSYQYEDKDYRVHETEDKTKGRLAITHFHTIATSKQYAWLQLQLETGRKNQIRVHCQSAGHPVVGDKKYGAQSNPLKRLCLHAHLLAFQHPFTKKYMKFFSPIPEEFYSLFPYDAKKIYAIYIE